MGQSMAVQGLARIAFVSGLLQSAAAQLQYPTWTSLSESRALEEMPDVARSSLSVVLEVGLDLVLRFPIPALPVLQWLTMA